MNERRSSKRPARFTEKLSLLMVIVAAFGAFYVLIDPVWAFTFEGGTTLKIGGLGFSADLKGMVIAAILIGGWTAVKEFWLGASASGQTQQESMSRIAEAAQPPKEPT